MFVGGRMVEARKRGPQPYEGILSVLCESFHGLPGPGAIADQDWPTMKAILDYRMAEAAVEAFNDRTGGMERLARNPAMMEILHEMIRAQTGANHDEANAILDGLREPGPTG